MPFINSEGVKIFYKKNIRSKDKNKITFVLLHGAGSNHSIYNYLDKFNYIAPDLRGHGLSSNGNVNIKDLADDIKKIIKKEKLRNFVVVGNSASCCIAMELYKAMKDRVKAIALISPFSKNTTRFSSILYLLFNALTIIFFWKKRKKIFIDYSKKRNSIKRFFYELYIMNLKNYFKICKESIKYRIDFNFDIPCYICLGKKDITVKKSKLRKIAKRKKNIKIFYFNSDHLIITKCKSEFEKFLKKIEREVK